MDKQPIHQSFCILEKRTCVATFCLLLVIVEVVAVVEYSWVPLPNESKHFVFGFPLPFCDWICLVCALWACPDHPVSLLLLLLLPSVLLALVTGGRSCHLVGFTRQTQIRAFGHWSSLTTRVFQLRKRTECSDKMERNDNRKRCGRCSNVAFVIVTPVISASHCNVGCNRCGGAFMVTWIMDGPGRMTKDSGTGGQAIGAAHTI